VSYLREFHILLLNYALTLPSHPGDASQTEVSPNFGLAPSAESTSNAMGNVLVPAAELLIWIASMSLPVADTMAVNAPLLDPLVIW
jgi:hypothetical protein